MLRKMLWKTFTLGDLCFPIHFLRFFPKLDKPQLVPFSLVHFFLGCLIKLGKSRQDVRLAWYPWRGERNANCCRIQFTAGGKLYKTEMRIGRRESKRKTYKRNEQSWLSCKKFFVKIAGREFLNAVEVGWGRRVVAILCQTPAIIVTKCSGPCNFLAWSTRSGPQKWKF